MVAIVGAAFYIRLAQGPVSLDFMSGTIQSQINANLQGMGVSIGGVIIERDRTSGVPHFRLRDIALTDDKGNVIARAPRAAVGVDEKALFTGAIVPKSLQLIGPRILVRRNLAGGIELGFGAPAASESEAVVIEDPTAGAGESGKTDHLGAAEKIEPEIPGKTLIDALAGQDKSTTAISSLEDIRVTDASIRLYDEANQAVWNAPKAELVFRRMPYGFIVVTNATVASGGEEGNWRTELSATYRRDSRTFSISARIYDLIPANISDEIFALAKLARVRVPLSGHAEIDVSAEGVITKASAEFLAAAGEVGLPDYLAHPIIVDEGSLRADYDPVTGGVTITDSALLIGGSRAELTGNVLPIRHPDGRLSALKIDLKARDVSIDAQGTVTRPVAVDRIDFSGTASVEEARLDIDDLVVMSGNAGVRLRGRITGGEQSAGLLLSGRIRDVPSDLLKRLWPPVMAPKTRDWVNNNIKKGRITDGEFRVDLPANSLARAQAEKVLPDKSIQLRFGMAGVTTSYFKDLPFLREADGEARLEGNEFTLRVTSAQVTLPSGKEVALTNGKMDASNILAPETPAIYTFDAKASMQAVLEYLDLPALAVIKRTGIDSTKLGGDATMSVTLKIPLVKGVTRDRIVVEAEAKLENASLEGALPGIDLTDGSIAIGVDGGEISAAGPVKINGIDAAVKWRREAGEGAKQSAVIEATLDDKEREKIGAKLGDYLTGPVSLKATIPDLGNKEGGVDIDMNLAKAELHLGMIGWNRPAKPKTRGSLTYYAGGKDGRRIENLDISGPDLVIKGDIKLGSDGGFREIRLGDVQLSDENNFALLMKPTDDGLSVSIKGSRFDARPLIKSMFGPSPAGTKKAADPQTIAVEANVGRIYAHRGEVITDVVGSITTRGSTVQNAEIQGAFLSGQPIVMRITPADDGRELRITGRDGGAALRAANLYSKVAGGQIEFTALLSNDGSSSVRRGELVMRDFEVRNEAALVELDKKGKPKKSGPRKDGVAFKKLTLPFTTDAKFVRLGDSLIRGPDLGATAEGLIRKADGAIDITGTIIPAYGLNSAISGIPLVGDILAGGKGEGIIGITFALGGTMAAPAFQINPVSAIAPGILRKFFEYGGSGPPRKIKNAEKG